jgi:hypothetical protein
MLAAPPAKPIIRHMTTDETARKYFTLRHRPNTAFCIPNRTQKMAILSFDRLDDIHILGHMIESHVKRFNEWPEVDDDENMKIYVGQNIPVENELEMLSVVQWEENELKLLCATSYLDLLHIEDLKETPTGFSVKGRRYIFEGNHSFYSTILNDLYAKE